jgi:hypothetical protein
MHLGLFVCLFIYLLFIYLFCVVDGNEIVSNEDNNNNKGKGKYEWKLVSEDENVEQSRRDMTFSSMEELFSYYRRYNWKRGFGW